LNGMAGIEVARVCAIVVGICVAFTCSMVFRSVDGGALELERALRKSMSAPSEQTVRMAPVRAMAAE
jgi:ribulose kinase